MSMNELWTTRAKTSGASSGHGSGGEREEACGEPPLEPPGTGSATPAFLPGLPEEARMVQGAKKGLFIVHPEASPVPAIARGRAPALAFPIGAKTERFRKRFFPESTRGQWSDWRWQLTNRVTTRGALERFLRLSPAEYAACASGSKGLPLAVTPYYLGLMDANDIAHPLRRCMVPSPAELVLSPGEALDPLGEEHDSPTPGLVHRYPDRVLFLTTDFCSAYCRYCTRSRLVGRRKGVPPRKQWQAALDYIAATPTVRDVILSGGDPLTMPEEALEWLLAALRRIKHVEVLRIGTKAPAVLPQRITRSLTRMLKKYHPLWMSLHCTHPLELTPEMEVACNRLADAGIPLGSQTVLLKGVNDSVDTLRNLYQGLMRMRVRPYYLYQCDPIQGSAHFRTPVSRGLEMIQGLRGHTSGYAVPSFVIDAPGGGGKIPLLPETCLGHDAQGNLLLRNYEQRTYLYPDGE